MVQEVINDISKELWLQGLLLPVFRDSGLTKREQEVALYMILGHSDEQMASSMVLAIRTVENHCAKALKKLGLSNRKQFSAWLIDLVMPLVSVNQEVERMSA